MAYIRSIFKYSLLLFCFILPTTSFAMATLNIISIQLHKIDVNTTEIKLIFTNKASFRYFLLEQPSRFVININNGAFSQNITPELFNDTLIKDMRYSTKPDQILRLVFDLNNPVKITQFKRLNANTAIFQLKSTVPETPSSNVSANSNPAPAYVANANPPDNSTIKPLGNTNFSLAQDSLLGPVGQIKSAMSFHTNQAAALELDGGAKVLRVNGTYGFAINDSNRVKLSAEYLLENLDFSFYTGDTQQWVDQGAIGAAYEYLLGNTVFQSVALGGHYSYAPSKDLSTQTITYSDGSTLTDYRRIAGGDDWNGTAETSMHLWPKSLLSLGADYDRVHYDTEYCAQNDHDAQGLGGHLRLQQLLNTNTEFEAQSTASQLFNTYGASLNWLWTSIGTMRLSAGLNSSYTQDHTTERNFWVNGIALNIIWDTPQAKTDKPHYDEPQISQQTLLSWVETPAVRMPDVLAISDEYVVKTSEQIFTPIKGACPAGLDVQYDSSTNTYSAPGGWVQSYLQVAPATTPFVIAFDSANLIGNPSGSIACFYIINGRSANKLILNNNIFTTASTDSSHWVANGTSLFWPSTQPTPSFTCPAVVEDCGFKTAAS